MTLRTDLLPVFEDSRQLIEDLGLRQYRVWRRLGVWDGGEALLGTLTETDVELTPRPKVTQPQYGWLKVTGITPSFATGGWTPGQLQPDVAEATEFYYVTLGPDGVYDAHRFHGIDLSKNFKYEMMLQRISRARPDY